MKAFPIISARRLSSTSWGLRVEWLGTRSAQLVVIAASGIFQVAWFGGAPSHLLSTAREYVSEASLRCLNRHKMVSWELVLIS